MRVKIIRQTFIDGEAVKAGKTGNLPDALARQLITAGKAVAIDDEHEDDDAKAPADRQNDGSGATKR